MNLFSLFQGSYIDNSTDLRLIRKDILKRVLQTNLDDAGGAFSLIFQVQKELNGKIIFDYYSMGSFQREKYRNEIYEMKGIIKEANLRSNRLFGHLLLPYNYYNFLIHSNYEIVHIHSDTAWKMLLYAFAAKKAGIRKIVVHSHSSDVNGDYRFFKYLCHRLAKPFVASQATDLLTCSDIASKWMYPQKYQAKVKMVNNGIDIERFVFDEESRKRIRNELMLEEKDILIGTVGNYSYQKNPELLLDVFKLLKTENDRCFVIFVGEGQEKNRVKEYAKTIGVHEDVIYYGNAEKIEELYSAMDIFIMTSRFEGLPVSAVEAQANGLPCILSDKISIDTKLLNNCLFVKNEDLYEWVNMLSSLKKGILLNTERVTDGFFCTRIKCSDIVRKKGFDISATAAQIMKVYGQ